MASFIDTKRLPEVTRPMTALEELAELRREARIERQYQRAARRFEKWSGGVHPDNADQEMLKKWVAYCSGGGGRSC